MYIPDPIERMENAIERQVDLIDKDNTYPCCHCGKRFDVDTMHPISADPSAPLECGNKDCC